MRWRGGDPYIHFVEGVDRVLIMRTYRALRDLGVPAGAARIAIHQMIHVGIRSTFRWAERFEEQT